MSEENDYYFGTFKLLSGGTTSPRIAKLLNFATSLIGEDECYLEVGVFTGFTLCAAGFLNGRKCVGIDNFDMTSVGWQPDPKEIRERCLRNIQTLSVNTRLIESDFRKVTADQIGSPVAVSFIDGRHETKEVLDNLEWLHPLLADQAILVFDDVGLTAVDRAIKQWWISHQETFDLLAYCKPHYVDSKSHAPVQDEVVHQGVCVMRYDKKGVS